MGINNFMRNQYFQQIKSITLYCWHFYFITQNLDIYFQFPIFFISSSTSYHILCRFIQILNNNIQAQGIFEKNKNKVAMSIRFKAK